MIEITEHKMDELTECAEKMLRYGGKLMSCMEELKHEGSGHYGNREPMDYRMGYRDDDDDIGERSGYGDRRGVKGTGHYSRY